MDQNSRSKLAGRSGFFTILASVLATALTDPKVVLSFRIGLPDLGFVSPAPTPQLYRLPRRWSSAGHHLSS